jgi:hypothetical protein
VKLTGLYGDIFAPAAGLYAAQPKARPIHAWTLDNTSDGYVDFVSGLTLTQQGTGTSTAAGIIGDAASFNGSGWLASAANIGPRVDAGLAVECWLYLTSSASATRFIFFRDNDTPNRDWSMAKIGVYSLFFQVSGFSAAEYNLTSAAVNTWVHAVGVVGADLFTRLYVNGVLRATSSGAITPRASTNAQTTIGSAGYTTTNRWIGRVDEPRIWQFGASGDPGASFWLSRYNGGVGRRP